jgi:hypothetical protein
MAMDTAANDASTYSLIGLKRKRNKPEFETLDFSNVDDDIVDELFPVHEGRGALSPPMTYRTSAKRIREWRRLSKSQQIQESQRLVTVQTNAMENSQRRKRRRDTQDEQQPWAEQLADTIAQHTKRQQASSPQCKPAASKDNTITEVQTNEPNENMITVPSSSAFPRVPLRFLLHFRIAKTDQDAKKYQDSNSFLSSGNAIALAKSLLTVSAMSDVSPERPRPFCSSVENKIESEYNDVSQPTSLLLVDRSTTPGI